MKISVILPFTFMTGGIKVICDYGNYLNDRGHEVIFYLPFIPYRAGTSLWTYSKSFLGNILLNRYRFKNYNHTFKLKVVPIISNCFLENADLVLATAWFTAYSVNKLKEKKGKKVYFIQDYEIWSGEVNKVEKTYQMSLNKIVITKWLQRKIFDKFGQNSYVIYNGTNNNEYCNADFEKKGSYILMMYSYGMRKCSDEGVKILKELHKKLGIRVVIFGKKKYPNIPEELKFYEDPERDLLIKLYRDAAIYLFTSSEEAWGLPVMEAMANKCAVVGTRVGCVEELGKHGENMMISEPNDFEDLKQNIEILWNNPILLKKIQDNGYRLACNFRWSDSCEKMEKYLLRIHHGGEMSV